MSNEIKLLHFYVFGDLTAYPSDKDFSGIWETVVVKGLDTDKPIWTLTRRLTSSNNAPVGEMIDLPGFVMDYYAKRIDRKALAGI